MPYNLQNVPNVDYLYKLMDVALLVCKARGKIVAKKCRKNLDFTNCLPGDYNIITSTLVSYEYDDDKIHICITAVEGGEKDCDYKITVTINAIRTDVFDVEYPQLNAYRPGKWEQYLFSMEKEAKLLIKQQNQEKAAIRLQKQKEAEEHEKIRFQSVNDFNIF